ncbi:MAG: hypothetical protein KAI99_07305 [Cyclobacteriaceae bacterium]|nr:hypothetical protein [Cyclobacteriaceae bacterium]
MIWITMWSQQIRHPVGIEFDTYVFPAGDNGDNLCVTRAADRVLYTSQCDDQGLVCMKTVWK